MTPETGASQSVRRADGFSLLLPVYAGDDAAHLRLAFESSVNDQTLRPSEVVIVQDGPVGDEIAAELQRYVEQAEAPEQTPVTIVTLSENSGLTAALNAGLSRVSFEIVARMDSDDVSLPERFERQWELMREGYDLVGTGMVEFDHDHTETGASRIPPVGSQRIRDHARTHNPFNHPTMMYRAAVVERVGGYETFGKMEDYWLGVRIIASGARVENIAEALVKYRVGSGAFQRRGGWQEANTEVRLQRAMLQMGFITRIQFARNVVMKSVYRLLPASVKKVLFRRFIGKGLPGDQAT